MSHIATETPLPRSAPASAPAASLITAPTTAPDTAPDVAPSGAGVEICDLTWRPFGREEPVLTDISLRIEPGSRVLIAGPSGSGKSTLLRALAGVLTTTEAGELNGSILIDGSSSAGSSVGLLMQDPGDALVAGRVGRDVAFGPEGFRMARSQIWSRVRSALASVGFPYDEQHATSALSGGETQRLALAGVLALSPRLVLLDEPTSMLDPSSAAVIREAITSAVHASGATLVMVEHRLSDWVDKVDRLVVLDMTGRVSADGPVTQTLARSASSLAAQGVWVPGFAAPRPLNVARALCRPSLAGVAAVGTVQSQRPAGGASAGSLLVSAESVSVVRRPRATVMSANGPALGVPALWNVSAEVRAGECVAVVGPSGAGKSTLTALLAGVEAPTEGQVAAGDGLMAGVGANPSAAIHRWTSPDLAARFGWVPQQAQQVVVARTVRDDVLSTSRHLGLDDELAQAQVDDLLEVLGLSALAGTDPHHLSGGELRRMALAGAIAHGPSVLVLDEPSIGQDRSTWSAVAGVVVAARDAGIGVVLATHDPLLIALADRRITLRAGRIVDSGRIVDLGPVVDPTVDPGPQSSPGGLSTLTVPTNSHARFAGGWIGLAGRCGPLSLLLSSIVLVLSAPFISNLRTALVAFGVEVALAPLVLGVGRLPWRRLVPGLLAVASVTFSNWLLSPGHEVSTGTLAGLRVAFFVVPGVLLASRIDPSALGDHLGQRLHLPARPVVATVAALHRFEGLGEHWDQLARIRRVRGLGPGRSPVARALSVAALGFGLLVETLRQAGRMAVAMEARGFSAGLTSAGKPSAPGRTWAEPAPWVTGDSLMLALALAVAAIPPALSRL